MHTTNVIYVDFRKKSKTKTDLITDSLPSSDYAGELDSVLDAFYELGQFDSIWDEAFLIY